MKILVTRVYNTTAITCKPPAPTIPNAVIQPSTNIGIGSHYTITCNAGHKLSAGGSKLTCGNDGNLDKTVTCERKLN